MSAQQPGWRDVLDDAAARVGSRSDARRIVEAASGHDGAELYSHLDDVAPQRARVRVDAMVARRLQGEPLQYVIGRWGFRTLDLYVDGRVLIPRPETELVVEVALAEVRRLGSPRPLVTVDLGTGSGAIALSLAAEADAEVWATDASPAALAVARANLAGTGGRAATRVRLHEGHWYDALPEELVATVHLIVSNPPYVAEHEQLPDEVRCWEPSQALVAGPTGLEAIEAVLQGAPRWLRPTGAVVMELAPHQAAAAVRAAGAAGFAEVAVRPDLAGRARVLVASGVTRYGG